MMLVLFVSAASAASLSLDQEYDQGETILISVAGKVLEQIDREDIGFKRGHVLVPLEFEVVNLGGSWHVWALAPLNEEEYSVLFSDIVVSEGGVPAVVDLSANFSVGLNKTAYAVALEVDCTVQSMVVNLGYISPIVNVQMAYLKIH